MTKGVVVIYFSRLGAALQAHERSTLTSVARAIAQLKNYEFGGAYRAHNDLGKTFFVPDDTLMRDEAVCLDIGGPQDLFGGVVPYPFVKTKAITHDLIDRKAAQPEGWSSEFAKKVRDVVLPGYTVFSAGDARIGAERLLAIGPVRVKPPLATGGRAQKVITTAAQMDAFLERLEPDRLASYGLVLEPDLSQLATLSVGHVTINGRMITYYGNQRVTPDNEGQSVYGGSDLICVAGGWEALDRLPLAADARFAIVQARAYDDAVNEYPGFIASRRNYDVGQGLDAQGERRSGVFEASWRSGGASTAELAALAAFAEDSALQIVEASAVKKFGDHLEPPPAAIVHFHGEDPEAGPMLRYTLITRRTFKKPRGPKREREIAVRDQSSEERKMMISAITKFAAVAIAAGLSLPVFAADGDWSRVGEALGKPGTEMPGGVYKIGLPRTDLKVTLDGVDIKPGFALGGWLGFEKAGAQSMVMGDLVLTGDEVSPVMEKLLAGGIQVTALHNHLLRNQPFTMYMHVMGMGDPVKLATVLHAALAASKTPLAATTASSQPTAATPAAPPPIDLDTAALDRTLGAKGTNNGGIYQFSIPRAEAVKDGGMAVPPALGSAQAINFQPTGSGNAAITGDFVLTAKEVAPVMKALRDNGIEITALHNHMLDDQPRLFFMHFWANDDAGKLAQGLGAALSHVNIAKG